MRSGGFDLREMGLSPRRTYKNCNVRSPSKPKQSSCRGKGKIIAETRRCLGCEPPARKGLAGECLLKGGGEQECIPWQTEKKNERPTWSGKPQTLYWKVGLQKTLICEPKHLQEEEKQALKRERRWLSSKGRRQIFKKNFSPKSGNRPLRTNAEALRRGDSRSQRADDCNQVHI